MLSIIRTRCIDEKRGAARLLVGSMDGWHAGVTRNLCKAREAEIRSGVSQSVLCSAIVLQCYARYLQTRLQAKTRVGWLAAGSVTLQSSGSGRILEI
jgi:hypothetical protein